MGLCPRPRRGGLALSLAAAWLLLAGQPEVRACSNPFDPTPCPVLGCGGCGAGGSPGSSGILPWLPYPGAPWSGPGGGGGGCPGGGCGGRQGFTGEPGGPPSWPHYWPPRGGNWGGGEARWPAFHGEEGPLVHPRPYGRPDQIGRASCRERV